MDGLDELRRSVDFLKPSARSTTPTPDLDHVEDEHNTAAVVSADVARAGERCAPRPEHKPPTAAGQPPPQRPRAAPASCSTRSASAKFVVRRPRPAARASSPQSTFKIPHALAALDAGVVPAPTRRSRTTDRRSRSTRGAAITRWQRRCDSPWCGGSSESPRSSARLASSDYLQRFAYGNADASSGLTTFWLGGSLTISPEEQAQFLLRLFANKLPVSEHALRTVRTVLVQPAGLGRQRGWRTPVRRRVAARDCRQREDRRRARPQRPAGAVARRPHQP